MRCIRTALISLASLLGGLWLPAAALAGPAPTGCDITASISGATAINYDPFNASGLNSISATLSVTRNPQSGGQKTQEAAIVFAKNTSSTSAAYQILYGGNNVLYTYPALPSLDLNGSAQSGVIYAWGTAADPDTEVFPVLITIPPGTDLSAGTAIKFDIYYECKGTGGLADVTIPTQIVNALTVNVNVLSALQASFTGPALDFGEVGTTSTATVLANLGGAYTKSGNIRVASSGPYSVQLASTNGYQLAAGAGTLNYTAAFLGQSLSTASPTFATATCNKAGIGGVNLPLSVTLKEGGIGKPVSPTYTDSLSVTVTPLVYTAVGSTCP